MQNRRALIIGIDKYPNLSPQVQLEGCVRDAREVAGLLENRFGFPGSQIQLLLDGDATRKGILDAMAELAKEVKENDAVVVHYSGHGSQRTALVEDISRASLMEETLVAHDSGHDDPYPNRDIASFELRDWLAKLSEVTPNITLILDCCHSGTIATMRHDGEKPAPKVRSVKPDTRQPPPSQKRRLRDVKGGPASFIRYVVLAACRDKENAHEIPLDDGSHGALTWNLLRELDSLPSGACPTYLDVFEPVRSRVNQEYGRQEPQLEGVRDRELFGLDELVPMSFLPVQDRRADRVLLGGGATTGMAEHSIWKIHPPQAREGAEVLGRVEVIEVRGMTATASILEEVRPGAIGRWCRAVEESSGDAGLDSHWSQYRKALKVRNDFSRLSGKVDFNLGRLKNDRWERLDDGAEVQEGDKISFGVVSHHDEPLYIYVLDFGLTGNISQLYPVRGVSDPLAPGRTIEIGTMRDDLDLVVPDGAADGGEEILKLFASTREIDLSSLVQTVHPGTTRGEGGGDRTRDTQAAIDPTRGGDDWITIDLRFKLKRRTGGGAPVRVTRGGARAST
jgi:hypothetical protein